MLFERRNSMDDVLIQRFCERGLRSASRTSYAQVFDAWREGEAHNPGWIHTATAIKGWPDWESWREHSMRLIRGLEREWVRFVIERPAEFLPSMLIGPYSSWQEPLPTKNVYSFREATTIPAVQERWQRNSVIRSLVERFPTSTVLIGAYREDIDRIVCVEGHHRCAAVAFAEYEGMPMTFAPTGTSVALHLMTLSAHECHLIDDALKRGTSAHPL